MKPTTFESEIDQIFGTRGTNQKWQKEQIYSLLQTTIRECIVEPREGKTAIALKWHQMGFNDCLDTITKNLKEKGLL